MDKKTEIFENMPVRKALATLAIPSILSQLVSMIYNLADTLYIGQTGNPFMVAGVSISFPLFFMLMSLGNLFGIGGGSLISRMLGAKRPEDAKRVSSFSFWTGVACALTYSIVLYLNLTPILRLLGASDNTIGWSRDYITWVVVVGGVPSAVGVLMGHFLRSEGYAKYSSIGIAFGGILNIILDPIFIFPLNMAVKGAAIATLISNVCAMCYYFIILKKLGKKSVLSVSFKNYRLPLPLVKQIFSVGLPAALANVLASASAMFFNKLASGYGDITVAAIGISRRIDMIPMSVGMGLTQGMMPLMAYNYAAKNYKRMEAVNKSGRFAAYAVSAFCILIFQLIPEQIVSLFIRDPATIKLGAHMLRVSCIGVPLMITNFMMNTTFQAMGKGMQSFILTICRQGLIALPLMILLNAFLGLFGLIWSQPAADALTMAVSLSLKKLSG
jgi:putative MATE family efflux protein